MELLGVSENDQEYVVLHLEEQLGDRVIKDIHYFAEKQTVVVFFVDDYVVDDLFQRSQSFVIDGKSYRTRRVYTAELLDLINSELVLLYLDTYIGKVAYDKHYPDERRLLVAFDTAQATEKLCEKACHVIEEGVAFRVKQVSVSQKECLQQQQQMQQPLMQHQYHQQQVEGAVPQLDWQQQFLLQTRQQEHEHEQKQQQQPQEQQQVQRQQQSYSQVGETEFQADRSLILIGISETISKPALELELTKQWKQVGVNHRHVDYNPSLGIAVVSLSAADDVKKVLQDAKSGRMPWSIMVCDGRQKVYDVLGDVVLLIENISPEFSTEALWGWLKVAVGDFAHTIVYSSNYNVAAAIFAYFSNLNLDLVAGHTRMHIVDGRRLHVTAIRHAKRAKAVDLPEKVTIGILKNHLEDSRRGGMKGSVALIEMMNRCVALITFSTEYALSRAIGQKHVLLGQEISLVPLFDDVGPVTSSRQVYKFGDMKRALKEVDPRVAIRTELTVTGFDSQKIDESALRQFLSQRRMSGGGDIMSFSCSKGKAVVTFVDSECATRIYKNYQCEGLQLCGCRLSASIRTFDIGDDVHKNQVLLRNIGVASDDSLKYWLWGLSDNQVQRIDFVRKNEDPQLCALIHFARDIDFRCLVCSLKVVTLDGLLVEPDLVSQPRSVLAGNFPDGTHPDLVHLCFGCIGSVQDVRELLAQQWVITFCHSKDAVRACNEKIVFRDNVELQIRVYTDFHIQMDARKTGQRGRLVLPLDFVDRAVLDFVLAKRKAELVDLLQPFGSTIATEKQEEAPSVICSLSQSDPLYRDVVQRWQTLHEACLSFFSPFQRRSIPVSTDVYEAVISSERFSRLISESQPDMLVTNRLEQDRPFQEIIIAGTLRATDETLTAIMSIVRDVSESVERSKQRVKHTSDRMTESEIKLLDSIGFCRSARLCYKELNVDLNWENRMIHFEGLPGDIAASTEEMKRILGKSSEDTIKGSTAMLDLLARDSIRNFVDGQLEKKKLTDRVVWYMKPSVGICVRGVDSQCTHDAATIVRTQLVDTPITLDADHLQLIAGEKWETFSRDIVKRYHDNLILKKTDSESDQTRTVLRLACLYPDSERILEEVQEFLRRQTQKEIFISLPRMTVEFIARFMQDNVIAHIEKNQSRNFVKMNVVRESTPDRAKTGFQIVGNQDGIINAKRTLAHLMKTHKVSIKQHNILSPGAEKHFKSQEAVLSRIGDDTQTIICLSSGTDGDMELDLDESGLLAATNVSLPCGTELQVLRGDIIQLTCDVIVNPANTQLQHTGGLAKVIIENGGQAILDECAAFIRTHGQLIEGQACVTAAGALPCKKVIHAVGPKWQGGNRNEENKLFSTVQNSLSAAAQHSLTSIAIPPISSGIFGYPLDKCTKTIVESVADFCTSAANRPKKVIFVDNKSDGAKYFKQAVDKLTGGRAAQTSARGSALLSTKSALTPPSTKLGKIDEPGNTLDSHLDAGCLCIDQVTLPCNAELRVLKGDITQLVCDAIVSPTNGQLQHTGGLARIIANKGGQVVLDGCAAFVKLHGKLKRGQVCVTAAGALSCKKVIHAVGPQWQGGSRNEENKLFGAVQNALAAAGQHGLISIAVPPISSGIFGYPLEECTRTIVESIADFCKNAAKPPKKIILVDNKSDGVECFKQAVDQVVRKNSGAPAQAAVRGSAILPVKSPKRFSEVQETEPAQVTVQQPLAIGNAVVELIKGSLVDQKVDVMVSTIGPQLLLNQGVLSVSVGVAAGPAMQLYLTKNYQDGLAEGEIAFTAGFQLPCQFVFHCCCSSWLSDNAEQVLSDLLSKCLAEASQRGMSSIAIPAIGTGNLAFPAQESAKITYEAVLQHYRAHPSSSVRLVKLVVHGPPSVVTAFQAQHAAIIRDGAVSAFLKPLQSATSPRGRGSRETDSIMPRMSGAVAFSMALSICGKEDGIAMAIKALEGYCQKNIAEYIVSCQDDGGKMLSGSQFDDLVQQGLDDGVAIEADLRNNRVIIRSLERSAAITFQLQVGNIINFQRMECLHQETIAMRCQWQVRYPNERWRDYDASLNVKLEQAHRTGEKKLSYRSTGGTMRIVNFAKMKDYADGDTASVAEVQRIDKEQGL